MMLLHATGVFGIGIAFIGLGGAGVASQACHDARAIRQADGEASLLSAMLFMLGIDLFVVAMGLWMALLETSVWGAANG